MEQLLERIGLTNAESKVYLALLELGSSTAGPLIDKAKITPSKVYDLLDKLQRKGLVSVVTQENVRHYEAASPERLVDYLEERERTLQMEKEQLQKTLPQLKLLQMSTAHKSQAIIYKDVKGVETALYSYVRNLDAGAELLLLGLPHLSAGMKPFYQGFFRHCLHDLHLRIKILLHPTQQEQLVELGLAGQDLRFQDVLYASPMVIMRGACILLPKSPAEPLAIVLENAQTVQSFEDEFYHLFNQEARILHGMEAVEHLMELVLENKGVDWIGARGYFVDANPEYIKEWVRRAVKAKICTRNIVDSGVKGHPLTKWPFSETKYTLEKEFAQMSCFWIFKEKVAITNYVTGKALVVLIENKGICELYRAQFESLWKKG
jgi:sugar-specific transcriptional regulator TrmB